MLKKLLVSMFCIMLFTIPVFADIEITPYASLFFNTYDNRLVANGKELSYTIKTTAVTKSDVISITGELQEYVSGEWITVDSFYKEVSNTATCSYYGSYTGKQNSTYRVYAELYIKIGNGSESKFTYSESVTVK